MSSYGRSGTESLLIVAEVLDLVVVVVEQPAEVELVVVLGLELDGVRLLGALLPEHHLALARVVVNRDGVADVVAEGSHLVVLGRVDRGPGA